MSRKTADVGFVVLLAVLISAAAAEEPENEKIDEGKCANTYLEYFHEFRWRCRTQGVCGIFVWL